MIQSIFKFSNLIDCYFRYTKENVKQTFRADKGFQLGQTKYTSNYNIGIDVFTDKGKIIITFKSNILRVSILLAVHF